MTPETPSLFQSEPGYVILLFALFVIPRVLQRWRLPSALTSFALGAIGGMGFGLFTHDQTLHLLSTFGIVSIFLFAGLEVDLGALRSGTKALAQHAAVWFAVLCIAMYAGQRWFGLPVRPAALVALALFTPSTGFIFDSLSKFSLTDAEMFWIKSKAVITELLALLVLFVALQSTTISHLGLAALALVSIVAILPPMFRIFAVGVAPWAPNSEFAFLVMLAVVASYATRQLGVYYLVGAFLVGVAARRFREALPALASERMLHAVEVFASFFAPFYFFNAGAALQRTDFSFAALGLGAIFVAALLPIRVATIALQRRLTFGESLRESLRVAIPLTPTLVFALVLVGILRDTFTMPHALVGGLIIYTVVNTLLPGFVFGGATPEYDAPGLPPARAGTKSVS
jgi:Kef-type K+ transport system membrane component KefB